MKQLPFIFKKSFSFIAVMTMCFSFSSCASFMEGMASAYSGSTYYSAQRTSPFYYPMPQNNLKPKFTFDNVNSYASSGGGSSSIGSSSSNNASSTRSSSNIPRTKCPNCTNGRRVYESWYGGYSSTLEPKRVRCNECGITYDSKSIVHRHDRCNTCHGTGYLD